MATATDVHFAKQLLCCPFHSIAETNCQPCSVAVALRAIGGASLFRDQLPAMLCSSGTKGNWPCSVVHGSDHPTTSMLCSSDGCNGEISVQRAL